MADTRVTTPARVKRLATQPIRAMLVSRSALENPRPLERWVRTTSPSRYSVSSPRFSSSGPTIPAIVVFPEPESPVNHRVKPSRSLTLGEPSFGARGPARCVSVGRDARGQVQPALGLAAGRPAAGAPVLALPDGAGAGYTADRGEPAVVQRVVGDVVGVEVADHVLVAPVGERLDLHDAAALVHV